MAIVREILDEDTVLTYSDAGMLIRGGFPEGLYAEAVDPISANRLYEETDIPIDNEDSEGNELELKAEAFNILMGNVND